MSTEPLPPEPSPLEPLPPEPTPARGIPWVTLAIAAMNVIVFAVALAARAHPLSPTPAWMLEHGGNFGPFTLHGEPWRLFTSMFLHYGLLHIAMNLIGLLDGGRHVERMYGRAGFAVLYLVSGLAGSLASALGGVSVSAGASGAIFGIFGGFGAFLLLHRDRLDAAELSRQGRGLLLFLGYNIFFGITADAIDMRAHLGGLAAGFVVGLALELRARPGAPRMRRALVVGLAGLGLVTAAAYLVPPPRNADVAALETLASTESTVLGRWNQVVVEVQANTIDDQALADVIERELLPPWRAALLTFQLSGNGATAREPMLQYMTARQEGWEMMLPALRASDQPAFQAAMERFNESEAILARRQKD